MRNLRTEGTWADGLNIHGAHKNILVEGCSASNTGDDCFAAWDSAFPDVYMENITFKDNHASNPHFNGNNRDCFSQFGGRSVNYVGNTCDNPTNAMIHFWIDFCGSHPDYLAQTAFSVAEAAAAVCYPSDAVSFIHSDTLTSSTKAVILR